MFIYSETCDKKIPEAQTLAAQGKLNEALEMLTSLEKQTRSGADTHSTGRVLVTIVQLCFEAKDWNQLNEKVIDLVKKRAQLKQAVAKMITECCSFLDRYTTYLVFFCTLNYSGLPTNLP